MRTHAPSVAIGLVGQARSGKTTLARSLAALLPNAQVVSFGEVIRERAGQLGLDNTDRRVLTDVGQRWVSRNPHELCSAVLSHADVTAGPLIIDGIRHRQIADVLAQQLRPHRLLLVHLDAPRHLLIERLCTAGMTHERAAALLSDPTELEIGGPLRALADVTVDATKAATDNLRYLIDCLARQGVATSPENSW